MARWTRLASVGECPRGSVKELVVDGRVIALYNVDGQFFALDGVCPHQGGPLGEGRLEGCIVTCPWHGWQFDVRTGQHVINADMRQPTLTIRIVGDEVQVGF